MSSLKKNIKFYVSLVYGALACKLGARNWYDRIDDRLVLGALPILPEWDTIRQREGISHVISMVEPFEIKSFVLGPREAAERGVFYLSLPVEDFIGVPTTKQVGVQVYDICSHFLALSSVIVIQVDAALDFIDSCQGADESVYIHCKAGRTRSAYVVACYYVSTFNISPEEAVARIRNSRPHVVFTPAHWQGLRDYFRLLHLRRQ